MDRESLAAGMETTAAELREQLAQMTAASQLLERTAGARELGYLAALNQSICRMLRTVSRIELAHRLTDENEIRAFPEVMDLGPWAENLARRAQGTLAHAGVTLDWQAPSTLLLNGDAGLLSRMVLELLSAAACAGKQVKLAVTQQGDKAHITVTGSGQAPVLPKMPDCLTDGGEELGLSMIRLIAQLHGGTLVSCTGRDGTLSLSAILPQRLSMPAGQLKSPRGEHSFGGFDPTLIAFSFLLPEAAFRPDELP